MNDGQKALLTARNLVQLGRWRDAAKALGPALASEDTAYEALCLRAVCLLNARSELNEFWSSEAHDAVKAALRLDPHEAWAHGLMASMLLDRYRNAAALREATEAARLDPAGVWTLRVLAQCQLAVFRIDDARRTAEAAVEADPQDPIAYLTLADVARAGNDWAGAERAYREGLRLDPNDESLALGLADLLFLLRRPLESAAVYLAAARINARSAALPKALSEIWWYLRIARDSWQRNPRSMSAPAIGGITELIRLACSPPIDAAVRELLAVTSRSRITVEKLLERALDVFGSVAGRLGADLYTGQLSGELKKFDYPMPEPVPPAQDPDWSVLDMEGDPIPDDVSRFRLAVSTLEYDAELTAEYGSQFDAAADGSAGLRVRDGDDADFHEIMVKIHAETTRLATAYRACADALSDFARSVELARSQASGARIWAGSAHRAHDQAVQNFRSLVRAPAPPGGDWRALDEFMAEELIRDLSDPHRKERSLEIAREAREWEEERQEAKLSALKALNIRAEAENRCVEAIRSVLPPDAAQLAAVDERDALPVLPPMVESLPDASEIERLLAGLDGTS
ncbi:tetratricopeptide repeat protein [Nonomuraea sp. NPDC050022]|uniref:tetratricopeptide repeat protein n=1 Tax=Nonomuraea sp. NPDC050022 TaxID=3364358 RepID=UPI0037B3D4CB